VFEHALEIRQRTNQVKKIIAEYQQKYKKIAVVSHYYTIQTLLAEEYEENGDIKNHV
jgi:hypothetical protein